MQYPKSIIEDGIRFTYSGSPYYYNSNQRDYLHRYRWKKVHGDIPEGYEIHHKDHNPYNNELDNLEMIEAIEHKLHHAENLTTERRNFMRKNMLENAIPAAVKWHKSEDGKEWHKEHYQNFKHKLHEKIELVCDNCGKEFITVNNGTGRFCSGACKAAWRRKSGVDDVVRKCSWCGVDFTVNKYSKTHTCTRSCTNRFVHKERKLKDSPNLQEKETVRSEG